MTTIRFDGEVKPSPQSTDRESGNTDGNLGFAERLEKNNREGRALFGLQAVVKSEYDDQIHSCDRRVLGAIALLSVLEGYADAPRTTIAAVTGLACKTVSNSLCKLKRLGYLAREFGEDESHPRSALFLGEKARNPAIMEALMAYTAGYKKAQKVPYGQGTSVPYGQGSSLPAGNNSSPGAGNFPTGKELEFPMGEELPHGQGTNVPHGQGNAQACTKEKSPHTPLKENNNIYTPLTPQGTVSPPAEQASVEGPAAPDEKKAQRGTRLKPDWVLPKSWGEWALENFDVTPAQVRKAADEFADYWHSATGAKARKIEWVLVWRNWCRHDARRWRMKTNVKSTAAPDLLDIAAAKPKAMSEAEKLLAYEREMFGGDA